MSDPSISTSTGTASIKIHDIAGAIVARVHSILVNSSMPNNVSNPQGNLVKPISSRLSGKLITSRTSGKPISLITFGEPISSKSSGKLINSSLPDNPLVHGHLANSSVQSHLLKPSVSSSICIPTNTSLLQTFAPVSIALYLVLFHFEAF